MITERGQARKGGPGRPSLSGQAKASPQVTFRLSPALRAKVEARAQREGKRVSQIAREALEGYLRRPPPSRN